MRNEILIVGGGMMGCGIAAVAASAGECVVLWETVEQVRARILPNCKRLLQDLAQNEMISRQQADEAIQNIRVADSFEYACEKACLAIEAIVEDLSAKQTLFKALDAALPPAVTILSNTSGLRITDIGAKTQHRHRMATAHFWFPAHLVPLVEVVMSEFTDQAVTQAVKERLVRWGKAPVIVKKDLPGQLANRILQAVIREASAIVETGLATAQDVDTAVKMGMGIRFPVWGPLEHVDAVGLDLCERVQNTVLPDISSETSANTAFTKRIESGHLGFKSGQGFYDWQEKDMQDLQDLRDAFIVQSVKFIRQWGNKT